MAYGAEGEFTPDDPVVEDRSTRRSATPPAPDPFQTALQQFMDQLAKTNPQFFSIGQSLIDRGLGTQEDPLIAAQRAQASNQLRTQLGRSGFGDSSIGINEQAKLGQQFDLASIGRQDQLLQGGLGLQGMGLQNLTAAPQLIAAMEAARNAGKGGGGGGGGRSCLVICLVLTDELLRSGELSPALFVANAVYAQGRTTPDSYRGYRLWAEPLARAMRRRPWLRASVRAAVTRYCEQAAHTIGAGGRDTRAGRLLLRLLPAFSAAVAMVFHGSAQAVPLCPIYKG